jgi:hypothetical protein
MMHRKGIKRDAPLAYRAKLLRFALRHVGHLASGRSKDRRLLRAIVGELVR